MPWHVHGHERAATTSSWANFRSTSWKTFELLIAAARKEVVRAAHVQGHGRAPCSVIDDIGSIL